MSILKRLLLEGEVNRLGKELDYELGLLGSDNISNEGLTDVIKNALKKAIEYIKKFYEYIKDKILEWLEKLENEKNIRKVDTLLKLKYLSNEEIKDINRKFSKKFKKIVPTPFDNKSIKSIATLFSLEDDTSKSLRTMTYSELYSATAEYLSQYSTAAFTKDFLYIFDTNGQLTDLDMLLKRVDHVIDLFLNELTNPSGKYDIFDKYDEETADVAASGKMVTYTAKEKSLSNDSYPDLNVTLFSLIEFVDNLPSKLKSTRLFYKKQMNVLNDLLKELNKSDAENPDTRRKIFIVKHAMKAATFPRACVLQIIRYIGYISDEIDSLEYTSTPQSPSKKIFHLSSSKHRNDILEPKSDAGYKHEFLPPRISFAPSVEQCILGLSEKFEHDEELSEDIIKTKEFYVYEGIQEKGKTRYLKPALVESAMHGTIQHRMQEVCVATPISIKLVGKVKIRYRPKYPWVSKSFIVDIEKKWY